MTNPEYDAWLVDLDGTLYRARWVKLAMALELALFGWSALRTLRQFRHQHELVRHDQPRLGIADASTTPPNPFATQVAHTARALGTTSEAVLEIVDEWMFQRPLKWIARFPRHDLLVEVRGFKARGGRTALVSDYPAERKIEALRARDVFDLVVASGEANGPARLKPDPDGYLRAATRLGVRPERCLVIGDRDDADGAAARAVNMAFRRV